MANSNPIYKVTSTELTSIASAIRTKTGVTGSLSYPGGFISAIRHYGSQPYTFDQIINRSVDQFEGSVDITEIPSYCFMNYSELTDIPPTVFPTCKKIHTFAFASCKNLYSANFPACEYINAAFRYCSSLTEVNFPACSYINGAFSYCSSLKTADFPACSYLGTYAFYRCISLSLARFPACSYIGANAFDSCNSLTTISFPYCNYVGGAAFQSCFSLAAASFPACSYIGASAFSRCYNLLSLYLMSTSIVFLSNSNAFSSTPIGGYTTSAGAYGSVYVPNSLLASYKAANNWSTISARIVGI